MPELLDPADCRPTYPAQSRVLSSLLVSIRDHGQIVPALVRPIQPPPGPEPGPRYEIICGHRRHAAIQALRKDGRKIPFLAEIRPLSDAEAFRLADIDNRERTDISDYQRARTYTQALNAIHGGSQRALAASLNLSEATISRYIALASLPEPILQAFYNRDAILTAHAMALLPALKSLQSADRVMLAAKCLASQQGIRRMAPRSLMSAATIVARLLAAAHPTTPALKHAVKDQAGAMIARGRRAASGAITLHIPAVPLRQAPETIAALQELLASFGMHS